MGETVKIIVTGRHTQETIDKFQNIPGADVVFAQHEDEISTKDFEDAGIYVGRIKQDLLDMMPNLYFVQLFSAGANGFDWLPERVTLANAYGAYGDSIAEHMLTTTLMAMKRMPEYLEMQHRQGWELLKDINRFEGSKIMSVGMGAIGSAYLKKSHALGAICYGVRRTTHDKPDFTEQLVTPAEMDTLLPEMDVVALSLPGTDEVKGMFDERRLRLMKKTAILVNVGRGNSVVTDDLIRVMEEGHLKAACLDVCDPEPLGVDHPLWKTPRVYITPHISGGFRAGVNYNRVIDTVVENVSRVIKGEPPLHSVDKKLGY